MKKELPSGWSLKRLGDITERITRKNTINNNNVLTISAEHGFISQDKFFTKIVASKDLSKYILLYKGDFCYNKSYCNGYPYGVFRKLKNYDVGVATSLYIYFKIIEGDSTFFEYLFDVGTLNKQLSIISQEGVRNHGLLNVPIEDFFNMTVPFPPLDEQKRIADILSTFDDLIENLTKLIEKKEIYKKGIMQRVLTGKVRFNGFTDEWETVRLGDIVEMSSGGTPNTKNKEYYNGNIVWVTIKDITSSNKFLYDSEKKITKKGLENSSAKIFPINTILYAMYASIGECVISKVECATSQAILGMECSNKINFMFLYYLLLNNKNNAKRMRQTGTQPNLNKQIVSDFEFNIPSLEEQNKIAELLTLIDKDIEILKQLLHLRKLQKKGVMQKLLTGEVRV